MSSLYNEAIIGAAGQSSGYEIEQSLRFNSADSAYLNRTPASAGNRKTWTWSAWVKKSDATTNGTLFAARTAVGATYLTVVMSSAGDFRMESNSETAYPLYKTNALFRDPAAWYHFVVALDMTQATSTDRIKVWVNSVLQTTASYNVPAQNTDLAVNSTETHLIGQQASGNYFGGLMTEVHLIDGQALTPSSFGETDTITGAWIPKKFIPTPVAQTPNYTSTYVSGMSNTDTPQYLFDGSLYTAANRSISGVGTFSYSGSINTSGATTVRMAVNFGANSGQVGSNTGLFYVNGTDVTAKAKSAGAYDGAGPTWIDITTEAGSAITSFSGAHVSGVCNCQIYAIEIDGNFVRDADNGFGTNGFYLKFESSGIGTDSSGNSNTWTANNFSTSGTGTDVMSDTPTTNWATLNPIFKENTGVAGGTFANGNLEHSESGINFRHTVSTQALPSSGKVYVEVESDTVASSYGAIFGLMLESKLNSPDSADNFGVYCQSDGTLTIEGTNQGTHSAGDVFSFSVDMSVSPIQIVVRKNGTVVGTNPYTLSTTETLFFWSRNIYGSKLIWNFGQRAFEQTPPTGFKALNTSNLPTPTIKKGSEYFNTVLYNGTGAELAVSGVGFQPDFTWLKRRNNVSDHHLFDAVRGVTKGLFTNDTKVEETNAQFLKTFDTDGFTLGTNGGLNGTGSTNVAWNWKANGAGSSNTAGTITSTVSANATAGFSIVTYTGTNADDATVGHGLGVKPAFIIVKNRDYTDYWMVEHPALASNKNLVLNLTNGETAWGSGVVKATNSTVFTLKTNVSGSNENHNRSGNKYVAYCFSEVAGYSKFGSYSGNSSTDGVFVHLGFKPKWLLVKRYNTTGAWFLMDSARNTYNVVDDFLYPNTSDAENSGSYSEAVDFLSNGFKCRTTSGFLNGSGDSYIYAAFAENPFGGSGVSPATAR